MMLCILLLLDGWLTHSQAQDTAVDNTMCTLLRDKIGKRVHGKHGAIASPAGLPDYLYAVCMQLTHQHRMPPLKHKHNPTA